jgi:predicted transcriptional regulator
MRKHSLDKVLEKFSQKKVAQLTGYSPAQISKMLKQQNEEGRKFRFITIGGKLIEAEEYVGWRKVSIKSKGNRKGVE